MLYSLVHKISIELCSYDARAESYDSGKAVGLQHLLEVK